MMNKKTKTMKKIINELQSAIESDGGFGPDANTEVLNALDSLEEGYKIAKMEDERIAKMCNPPEEARPYYLTKKQSDYIINEFSDIQKNATYDEKGMDWYINYGELVRTLEEQNKENF